MVRNIAVKVSLDYEEWNEIRARANKEHLSLASYIRRYLFDHQEAMMPSPIEPVRSGIPKRIVSSQIVHAIQRQDKMGEVLKEMESLFKKGLKLKEVTEEMKMEIYENRKKEEYKPIKELHPPR